LAVGCWLVAYFALSLFGGEHVDSSADLGVSGCCPAPLTPDAAVAFPAASAGVLAAVAMLPVLMWFGARFALTGHGAAPRVVANLVVRVAVPAALIGAATAIAAM
jgi:hypothetical protein